MSGAGERGLVRVPKVPSYPFMNDQFSTMAFGMALGVGAGAVIGTAMDNVSAGIALGIALGAALGLAYHASRGG